MRSRERVADARRTSRLSRRAEALPPFDLLFPFFFFVFLLLTSGILSHYLFLSRKYHRLAEALEDDGGAGGQGGGQGNDGYDDGGKGGVSFFLVFSLTFSRVAASFFR